MPWLVAHGANFSYHCCPPSHSFWVRFWSQRFKCSNDDKGTSVIDLPSFKGSRGAILNPVRCVLPTWDRGGWLCRSREGTNRFQAGKNISPKSPRLRERPEICCNILEKTRKRCCQVASAMRSTTIFADKWIMGSHVFSLGLLVYYVTHIQVYMNTHSLVSWYFLILAYFWWSSGYPGLLR